MAAVPATTADASLIGDRFPQGGSFMSRDGAVWELVGFLPWQASPFRWLYGKLRTPWGRLRYCRVPVRDVHRRRGHSVRRVLDLGQGLGTQCAGTGVTVQTAPLSTAWSKALPSCASM